MKRNKLLIAALLGVSISLSSCGDEFLEGDNQVTLEPETATEIIDADPEFIDSYTSGIWAWMVSYISQHDDAGVMAVLHAWDMMGEDLIMYKSHWFNYDYQLDNRMGTYRRTNSAWNTFYTMINKANEIIDFFPEEPTSVAARGAYGNALAVRAYAYLNLIQGFANPTDSDGNLQLEMPGIPVIASSVDGYTQEESEELMGRNTVGRVFEIIEKDILKAIELLDGYERPTKNYINKAVAQGIAARYYLLAQNWSEAETMAKAARADYPVMAGDAVVNGIRDGFMDVNNTEWMWGFDQSSETSNIYASFGSHMSNLTPGYSGMLYSGRGIDVRLFNQMSDTDYRKMYWYNDADTLTQCTAPRETVGSKQPYAILKHGWDGSWTMDYLYMRGAEMVLIEAEALARQEQEAAAATVLAELMSKRDPSWNKTSVTVEDVYLQRRLELIGEGFVLHDLKRLAKGIDRTYEGSNHMPGFKLKVPAGDVRWTYQIPQKEIQENTHISDEDQNP